MKSFTGTDAMVEIRPSIGTILDRASLDRAALEQHFERVLAANGPALSRLAASYTNTISDRDDLLQEIAVAIWQALPRFRGECSERTFAFRIAHNRGINYVTRTRTHMSGPIEEIEVHDPAPGPESDLAQRQRADKLRKAVYRLPLAYRQVITLTLEGMGYKEISEVLGISESNVGVRLNRARQLLHDLLENQK
jgi:RNA polymerase sigma factor (sigma-70 family)